MCKDGDLCFEMEGPLIFGKMTNFDHHTELRFNNCSCNSVNGICFLRMAREDLRSSHSTKDYAG